MSLNYKITECVCDQCSALNYKIIANYPIAKLNWSLFKQSNDYKKYIEEYDNFMLSCVKPCFHFTADCGGDSISLCYNHLKDILTELESTR